MERRKADRPTVCKRTSLLFLLLSVLHLFLQMYSVGEQGLMGYCRRPSNWLEVVLQTVIVLHSVLRVRHCSAVMEAAELLQNQSYHAHVDVRLLATQEQVRDTHRKRRVKAGEICPHADWRSPLPPRMKTLTVMKASRTLAAPAAVFTRSLCSLFWPMISGLILLMALSSVGNLIFCQTSWVFSSLPHSLQTVLCHLWGFKSLKILLISGKDLIYKGATHLSSTTVWTSMVMGVVMSWVQITQRSHSRRDVFTLADLTGYIRWRLSVFTGLKTPTWSENHMETKTYYLEEFESLVDELLFRLCVLSSCHPLPPRAYCYRNNSPHIAPRLESSNVDSEVRLCLNIDIKI
ncbi:polycystic kidney disease 1 like 1-like [Thalassophryne amazonica]|uniref:polycystic kidney disease 1 like 1-like n=1 Tax=Thalassophryne amazonica TaxID=390379 RepID=UPI001470EA7C|nr:polycystic kidney disease 1 like 1-like [Thalassophryne amazonica]